MREGRGPAACAESSRPSRSVRPRAFRDARADGSASLLPGETLGALGGDPDKGLMALDGLSPDVVERGRAFIDAGKITEEVVQGIRDSVDCNLYFFENKVEVTAMYLILVGSILALIGLYVLLNWKKEC